MGALAAHASKEALSPGPDTFCCIAAQLRANRTAWAWTVWCHRPDDSRASCIDHTKGWQAGVEGLTVQFTHSLNHVGFMLAAHVDLA